MEPEVGIGMGGNAAAGGRAPPRPSLRIRAMDLAGLAMLILGVGNWSFWQIALGGGLVLGSYAIYRRKHGPQAGTGAGPDGPGGDAGDGGGD